MKALSFALSLCIVSAVGLLAYASGQQTAASRVTASKAALPGKATMPAADGYVGVYVTSVARQVKMSDLVKAYPSEVVGRVDKAKLAADDVVGWYDKGQNFHEQKMQNNVKVSWGATQILPQTLRGIALRGAEAVKPE